LYIPYYYGTFLQQLECGYEFPKFQKKKNPKKKSKKKISKKKIKKKISKKKKKNLKNSKKAGKSIPALGRI
jgi:hypothetical protein